MEHRLANNSSVGNDKVLEAENAYAGQNYARAAEYAAEAVGFGCENADGFENTENIRKAVGIIYEVLVTLWSAETTAALPGKDEILKHAKHALELLTAMRNEERKLELMAEKQQLELMIGNLDHLWKQERKLIQDLKEACDRRGREIYAKKSASILLKLALLYMKRAPDKVSLLHSSALFAAILARDPSSQDDVEEHIIELDFLILDAARAKALETSLFDVSRKIYNGPVARMREKVQRAMKDMKPLGQEEKSEDEMKRADDIAKIELMITELADDYAGIMHEISDSCIKILGPPPCKFAHAAVGGLSTKQITTHSSLESVVLLDNDAKKSPDYESTLEYFRWYSIIFNAIVVYFGETPLHSIGVPWIWDEVTPCGLRFESLIPIRHKNAPKPLPTGGNPRKTELIMTTKDMVLLAGQAETWQRGCLLGEMLTRTSFIGGSKSLHKKFKKRVRKSIAPPGGIGRLLQLTGDHLHEICYEKVILDEQPDLKKVIFQTATVCLCAIGHLLELEENSCFDIVKALKSRGVINDAAYHNIIHAVALIGETRVRMNMDGKCESDMVVSADDIKSDEDEEKLFVLVDRIGRRNILHHLLTLYDFQEGVKKITASGGNLNTLKTLTFKTEDAVAMAETFLYFGVHEDLLKNTKYHDPSALSAPQNVLINLMKGLANMKLGRYEDSGENFNVCLALVLSLPEVDQPETPQCIQFCIGMNMLKAGNTREARDYFEQARKGFESNTSGSRHCDKIYLALMREMAKVHYTAGEYEQSFYECQALETRKGYENIGSRFIMSIKLIMANSLKEIGRYKESIARYEEALEIQGDLGAGCLSSSSVIPILTSLSECHFKVNNVELAQRYCNEAIGIIRPQKQDERRDLAHVKLLLSQCYLKQNQHSKAAIEACEACSIAFENKYTNADRRKITRVAVTVIFRSLPPVRPGDPRARQEYSQEDLRFTLDSAAQVLDMMMDESTFTSGEMERDRSILIRVIQRGTFDLGGYNRILEKCKVVFLLGEIEEEHPNFLQQLLSPVFKNPELRNNCKRDSERLIDIAKSCNIRDSISHTGALIVFVGWLFHLDKDVENWENLTDQLGLHLSKESYEIRVAILHCAVKVAIHVIDYYVSKIEDPSILEDVKHRVVSLIDFATKLHTIVQSQASSSSSLVQESAVLINSIGSCWMRLKEYDAALEMFNEALLLQETLEGDENVNFKGATAILENIAICLARLHRLDEASGYLRRTMSLKDLRKKTRAVEDSSFLEAKVNSASCSFAVGNYQEAASLACEAFHDGLSMDSDKKRNECIYSAAHLVLKTALESSVHVQSNKKKHAAETAQDILNSAVTLRVTLKPRREQLGKKFSDLYDSLVYATANCHLSLGQFKPALKCFKKTLKKLQSVGPCSRTEKSLLLHISKCLMGLEKYKKAARKLKAYLAMERTSSAMEHFHQCRAHNMIAVCLLKQRKYRDACQRAFQALTEAQGTCSTALYDKIAAESVQIFLETLCWLGNENIWDVD